MIKKYIKPLDTLRGLAALIVCLYHSHVLFNANNYNFVPHGYLAVDLFFVLSGFILVYHYEPMIEGNPPISFRNFVVLRFARLYPLFIAATFAGAAYALLQIYMNGTLAVDLPTWAKILGLNSLILPYLSNSGFNDNMGAFPYAVQSWSILWEFIVSLLFYFWVKNPAKLKYFIPIPFILLLILATMPNKTIDGGWQSVGFFIGGARAFASFSVGIITATIYKNVLLFANNRQQTIIKIAASIIGILTLVYACMNGFDSRIIELSLVVIGFPLIIIGLCFSNSFLFNNPIGNILGMASYSIYLTHPLLIDVTNSVITRIGINPSTNFGIFWVIMVIAFSFITYKCFEMPARLYFKKILWKK